MNILALEASAKAASCCVSRDGLLLAQSYQHSGLTHSRTLLPMVEDMLKNCELSMADMDVVAVANGPGSFTGLRIGVSTAKGLAWARDLPCAGCSTLESMAWSLSHMEGADVCCVMDARRSQVYAARFAIQDGRPVRLRPDEAISVAQLADEAEKRQKPQILVGDGWELCYNECTGRGLACVAAPPHLRFPSAWGVACCAADLAQRGALIPCGQLVPNYHRLSQAERERLARAENQQKGADHNG